MSISLVTVGGELLERDRERLLRLLSAWKTEKPGSKIISFIGSDLPPEGQKGVEHWNDSFDYARYYELWSRAYSSWESLLEKLSPETRTVLQPFFHSQADAMSRAYSLKECVKSGESSLILFPSFFPKRFLSRNDVGIEEVARLGSDAVDLARRYAPFFVQASRQLAQPRRQAQAPPAKKKARGRYLIIAEDGGTGVNLRPCLEILKEFRARGREAIVGTSSPYVIEHVKKAGYPVIEIAPLWLSFPRMGKTRKTLAGLRELRRLARRHDPGTPERWFLERLWFKFPRMAVLHASARKALSALHAEAPLQGVLLINETFPLSLISIDWGREKKIPVTGYWPILLGDRPDNRFFPAPHHLVYGDQLKDVIVGLGHPGHSVSVVGSPTYDYAFSRNREEDVRSVREKLLPDWDREKLVVVATEALPQPLIELEPVLKSVASLEAVKVVLKVHPADSLEFYTRHVEEMGLASRVKVVKDCDLLALLHSADLLVCVISNIIITAAVLGTPTLVCDFSEKRRVLDFVREGLCEGCFSSSEIRNKVSGLLWDIEKRRAAVQRLEPGLKRFNGPNDAKSAQRVVDFMGGLREAATLPWPAPPSP